MTEALSIVCFVPLTVVSAVVVNAKPRGMPASVIDNVICGIDPVVSARAHRGRLVRQRRGIAEPVHRLAARARRLDEHQVLRASGVTEHRHDVLDDGIVRRGRLPVRRPLLGPHLVAEGDDLDIDGRRVDDRREVGAAHVEAVVERSAGDAVDRHVGRLRQVERLAGLGDGLEVGRQRGRGLGRGLPARGRGGGGARGRSRRGRRGARDSRRRGGWGRSGRCARRAAAGRQDQERDDQAEQGARGDGDNVDLMRSDRPPTEAPTRLVNRSRPRSLSCAG